MHYCGVMPLQGALQLAVLEEVRTAEPPIRLSALFFEPGSAEQVAAELRSLERRGAGVGAPLSAPATARRPAPRMLCSPPAASRPSPRTPSSCAWPCCSTGWRSTGPPSSDGESGAVDEGAYHAFPLFETNADGVFCALQGRRLPAKRHPLGMRLRIDELAGDHVIDEGGDLWHRRIEELDAAACALCAHRYAVGHASWVGSADDGVIVLPGSSLPNEFARAGVLPPVERLQLPPVTRA